MQWYEQLVVGREERHVTCVDLDLPVVVRMQQTGADGGLLDETGGVRHGSLAKIKVVVHGLRPIVNRHGGRLGVEEDEVAGCGRRARPLTALTVILTRLRAKTHAL